LNRIVGARRIFFIGLLAIVLISEFVTASAVALTSHDEPPQPWPLSVAIVGDQYTAGIQNRVVWPTLMAQRTGWSVANFALPDAGFVADGRGGHAFTYQVDRAQGANPQVVVIVGGIADTRFPDTNPVSVGAHNAINKIKIDGERALVVGPTWFETPAPYSVRRVSEAVRKVAEGAGVPFLDALDPPWLTRDQMLSGQVGVTDEGQSVIADKIAAWLRSEVAR